MLLSETKSCTFKTDFKLISVTVNNQKNHLFLIKDKCVEIHENIENNL